MRSLALIILFCLISIPTISDGHNENIQKQKVENLYQFLNTETNQPSQLLENKESSRACCKICKKGKACGDSCISKKYICRKPPGCACNG